MRYHDHKKGCITIREIMGCDPTAGPRDFDFEGDWTGLVAECKRDHIESDPPDADYTVVEHFHCDEAPSGKRHFSVWRGLL
jgi:hypothetical protein